jgi:hypothetical protein
LWVKASYLSWDDYASISEREAFSQRCPSTSWEVIPCKGDFDVIFIDGESQVQKLKLPIIPV